MRTSGLGEGRPGALGKSILALCAAEAGDTSWQAVETLLLEGTLAPDDRRTLTLWLQRSWDRLLEEDKGALLVLQRASRHTSTFGISFCARIWGTSLAQAQMQLDHLAKRALIELVAEEPWPWQALIRQAYGSQKRYRLIPPLLVLSLPPGSEQAHPSQSMPLESHDLAAMIKDVKDLPIGPQQMPWRFWLANLPVFPVAWLFRQDTKQLEERLTTLWMRRGLYPPAEVQLRFEKSRSVYTYFGYAVSVLLILLGAWNLRYLFQGASPWWALAVFFTWGCALVTIILFVR